ncbi:MAG TPA: glycosyltransferase, partial [Candidatus Limnocylindrales bacterium]|nr:glycosyltransferase [Candidatus Limnocylindrales bacterium]
PTAVVSGPAGRPLAIAFLGDPNSIHLRRWAGWFAARGHRVWVLVPEGARIGAGLPAGIAIEWFVPFTRSRFHQLGGIAARRALQALLARLAPDVLHAHYLTGYGYYAFLSGFHPYAISVWGTDILVTARASLRERLYARVALSAADLVTGDSVELVRAAVAAGAHGSKSLLVEFGVDLAHFSPGPSPDELRTRLGLDGRRVLFSPRTITPLYRHDVVLEALARLPADVSVLMTSHLADPDERSRLERRAAELGVADRVLIIPALRHDAMVEAYRLAAVVVTVPSSDGTSVSLLEALAIGRPIVASDLPSVREWLGELNPEALVPVGDAMATARAIEVELTRSPEDQARMAQRGRAIVEDRASVEVSMARAEALYRSLVR